MFTLDAGALVPEYRNKMVFYLHPDYTICKFVKRLNQFRFLGNFPPTPPLT